MHKSVIPKHLQSSLMLCRIPEHLRYLGHSAMAGHPERWDNALELLCRVLPWWLEAETPRDLMDIATQSAFVLNFHPAQTTVLPVRLPGADLPWKTAPTIDNPTVAQAAQWCADIALDLATQFDNREGLLTPFEVRRKTTQIFEIPDGIDVHPN